MAHEGLPKPQQAQLHHEDGQRNGNANDAVPDAHGGRSRGEQAIDTSGKANSSGDDSNASNAAVEQAAKGSERRSGLVSVGSG